MSDRSTRPFRTVVLGGAVGSILLLCAVTGDAQEVAPMPYEDDARSVSEQDTASDQADSAGDVGTENNSALEASPSIESISEDDSAEASELEALKQRVAELERKSEEDDQDVAELKARLDIQEESQITRMTEREKELKVYGFLDVQFSKFFYPEDGVLDGLVPEASSFAVGHWNIFLEKPLGDHFRVLGEVRFLFQPLGEEADGWMGSGNFERVDTQATDWLDAYYFNWGGISIQRAYVEYKLNDYFGVRAGHYLTPYGIWNEDHASTVVISAHRPYLNTTGYLPEAQTGLYLFGRAFLGSALSVDYGLTVSNGRGPTVEVYDLDENKGLGLTLKLRYDGPVAINAGTYLYMGDCTDTARRLTFTENGVADFVEDITLKYSEKVFSVHLKLEWKGLLIQGEYARGLIEYENGKRPTADFGVGGAFAPDHVQQGAYALLGYMLPFDRVQVRPYLFYEYMDPPDWSGYPYGHTFGGGINWRIFPPVVWKIEAYRVNNEEPGNLPTNDLTVFVTQLAVSY